jgi:hypothetical protein
MLERLWEDGDLVLFPGKQDTGLARVLVVAPALEQPMTETIARLQHVHSSAGKLDPAWAPQPLELVHHEGRPGASDEGSWWRSSGTAPRPAYSRSARVPYSRYLKPQQHQGLPGETVHRQIAADF